MERELWTGIVAVTRSEASGHHQRQRKFDDTTIILTFLWAVLHDRPIQWATRPRNWPFYFRIRSRPTSSTMSRRLRSASVIALLERIARRLAVTPQAGVSLIIDAKPLPVGGYTTDRDARSGRACGCFAKGYKLYLILDESGGIHAWKVQSMNVAEQIVAEELIPVAARSAGTDRWLLGDKAYDSNRLYTLAEDHGLRLLAPRIERAGPPGPAQSPGRQRAIDMLAAPVGKAVCALMRRRDSIERYLGTLCCTGGGLSPLPGFVRGLTRVSQWVHAKLLLHAARRRRQTRVAA